MTLNDGVSRHLISGPRSSCAPISNRCNATKWSATHAGLRRINLESSSLSLLSPPCPYIKFNIAHTESSSAFINKIQERQVGSFSPSQDNGPAGKSETVKIVGRIGATTPAFFRAKTVHPYNRIRNPNPSQNKKTKNKTDLPQKKKPVQAYHPTIDSTPLNQVSFFKNIEPLELHQSTLPI